MAAAMAMALSRVLVMNVPPHIDLG